MRFEDFELTGNDLKHQGRTYSVIGAQATIDTGAAASRMTATRVIVGTALLPGIGTILGGMAKKNTSRVFVTIELATGDVLLAEVKQKKEGDARRFAAAINSTSQRGDGTAVDPYEMEARAAAKRSEPSAKFRRA